MFGDTSIIGVFDRTIDSKGRVIIPSCMNAEVGEEVGLAYGDGNGEILLMTLKKFKELYEKLEKENAKEVLAQDPTLIQRMKQLIGTAPVDKQGRVQIPQYALQKTGLEGNITMIGQITCIGIYKGEEQIKGR